MVDLFAKKLEYKIKAYHKGDKYAELYCTEHKDWFWIVHNSAGKKEIKSGWNYIDIANNVFDNLIKEMN